MCTKIEKLKKINYRYDDNEINVYDSDYLQKAQLYRRETAHQLRMSI